jgi:hypothetical protein
MPTVAREILDDNIGRAADKGLQYTTDYVHETGSMTASVRSPKEENATDRTCEDIIPSIGCDVEKLTFDCVSR